MQFLNPIWLWGLTGLVVPIGIHLLSRKEGKTIKVGSIRYLEDTATSQFKSMRLNEYLLLALRCLLVGIIVFVLSEFNLKGIDEKRNWLVLEPGLEEAQEFSAVIDSLKQNGFQIKFLSPGFPNIGDSVSPQKKINYWNLVQQLEQKSLKQVVIIAHNYIEGFKGKRPSLPGNMQWISKQPAPNEFNILAIQTPRDSVFLRTGNSNSVQTSFHTTHINAATFEQQTDTISIESAITISITIFTDSTFAYDTNIMLAALKAIDNNSPYNISVKTVSSNNYTADLKSDWVIFLTENVPSDILHNSILARSASHLENRELLNRTRGNKGYLRWILTQRLNEEVALQENLTVQLASILLPDEKYAPKAAENDKRMLPEELMWSAQAKASPDITLSHETAASQKYLTLLFLLLLLVERWVSFKRNQ
ncbi:BatA domain-containing protein [Chryseolinea sp. H1M3-3]|uniref:BatA domain-containing protein n=1 Tax=Chryseolinea sp. H1M3-3 TaxID=3034144 RepID=UPI0023ECD7CB|nr:BatA domain-containing protein [Chryseolinea sp. H1M3-3]